MRLVAVVQGFLEAFGTRIIDIEIHEAHLALVLCLQPVHDGRQLLARRSPISKELHQCRLAGGKLHGGGISRLQTSTGKDIHLHRLGRGR